jgi:hypothetical protein
MSGWESENANRERGVNTNTVELAATQAGGVGYETERVSSGSEIIDVHALEFMNRFLNSGGVLVDGQGL